MDELTTADPSDRMPYMASGYLHLGGPLHGRRVDVPGVPRSHTHKEPAPKRQRSRHCYGITQMDPPREGERHKYVRWGVTTAEGIIPVYVLDGYEPTPDDEALVHSYSE